jgi:hypothetical protein
MRLRVRWPRRPRPSRRELTEGELELLTTGLAGFCAHGVGMLDQCDECCPPTTARTEDAAMSRPTFEECRREAYRLLGDAADEIRMGDWPDVDQHQREEIRCALDAIGQAKDALNRAAQ